MHRYVIELDFYEPEQLWYYVVTKSSTAEVWRGRETSGPLALLAINDVIERQLRK